jgi:hypothetical protein
MPHRIEFDELLRMSQAELWEIMERAHPLDVQALADTQYQGIDLSLPPLLHRLLWKTFRKTFHRDPRTGTLRGWNVRMEQTGIDGPQVPKERNGKPWTFAHYEVRSAATLDFPRGWRGAQFLDYSRMGNSVAEGLARAPLVAVNEGDMRLLLGWEVFKVGPVWVPLRDYWVLRREGSLEDVIPPPSRR